VGLRSTRIRTYDNEMIIMPNGKLADSKIVNYLQPDPLVRGKVEFGVAYGSNVDKVRQVTLETIRKIDTVIGEPEPKVEMVAMADFSINFRAFFWVSRFEERFPTKNKIIEELYKTFNANGIEIPFPTRTVYMKQDQKP
ncbi:MAG TPA: mechanosensitive ion channel domain-containing protein, partial [Candidatus Nanoarchaeia archaeon]|nr:mechanosensitive ion channel domain-containing protein [Candidatus Nanoarchaeia archaeon]